MKKYLLSFFLILSVGCAASEKFGNWTYKSSEETRFDLVEIDNGLFLQFEGEAVVEADYYIDINSSSPRLILEISKESGKLFPFLIMGKEQPVRSIQIINGNDILDSVFKRQDLKPSETSNDPQYIKGRAKFKFTKFNISADCGLANYFAFDAELVNAITAPVLVKGFEDADCG